MSSSGAAGVQQGAIVNQKHRPNYSNDAAGRRKMEKESGLDFKVNGPQVTRIKIGIRIKNSHDIEKLTVVGNGNPMMVWKETSFPASEPPLRPPQPLVSDQCNAIYSTTNADGSPSGDRWFGFVAKYDPNVHGANGFDTSIVVTKVDLIPRKGFEPVTIAFTFEGILFATGHYIVATSVLPGEDSTFDHKTITLGTSGSAKSKKGPTSAKGKTAKSKKPKKKKKR